MHKNIVIDVQNLTKNYKLYDKPIDRLKESLSIFRKSYCKDFHALDNVSFDIKKGETVGIIGKNGSGKSTLLKIITGVLTQTSGQVSTVGTISSLLELGAGFNPEMTGYENIYLNGAIMGFSKKAIDSKVHNIIDFADIGDFLYQPMRTYSSGMFARLAFSVAINIDPDILIIDEALAVGDVYFVQKCMSYLRDLKKKGKTILFVTHDTGSIKNLCDKAIFLNDGRLVKYGNAIDTADEYLAHLFKQEVNNVEEERVLEDIQVENEENYIPNIEKRLGNQQCQIVGLGLYDKQMSHVKSSINNSVVTLRMTFINLSKKELNTLSVGFILKNSKGIEIASNNSYADGYEIGFLGINNKKTIKIDIKLPYLHQGNYTFTPTVGRVKNNGERELFDRVENAIFIEIYTEKEINTQMSLDTKYYVY